MLSPLLIYKGLFVSICAILFVLIVYGKLCVFHKKQAAFVSDYTSSIAMFITLYVITALVGLVVFPSIIKKLIFLGFAVSPFVIGGVAKYETEKYFTVLQLFVFVLSAVCAMRF